MKEKFSLNQNEMRIVLDDVKGNKGLKGGDSCNKSRLRKAIFVRLGYARQGERKHRNKRNMPSQSKRGGVMGARGHVYSTNRGETEHEEIPVRRVLLKGRRKSELLGLKSFKHRRGP